MNSISDFESKLSAAFDQFDQEIDCNHVTALREEFIKLNHLIRVTLHRVLVECEKPDAIHFLTRMRSRNDMLINKMKSKIASVQQAILNVEKIKAYEL